ncbi:MAG TPA: primosomal protein N' [Jiangellales bacterium]|nr:primosomal protein N' [Jiangellales bacterium]
MDGDRAVAGGEQLALVRDQLRRTRPGVADPVAEHLPVARVLVDVPLAHLDRPFDYLVPDPMAESAMPGVRVAVRFAGQEVSGFVAERAQRSDHTGRLARLRRVVSAEPVLSPQVQRLARRVADRYAGTVADVLRLAVPPRHARVEARPAGSPTPPPDRPAPAGWARHRGGTAFLDVLADRGAPRAVWTPLPGLPWPNLLARALVATAAGGRGALAVVPDARDLALLSAALVPLLDVDALAVLSADLGPAERYRRWLAVRRGQVRVVVGTRAAAFTPVADLGLVAVWDDGDDLHAEPRAPYPHTREVLLLRAHDEGAAALVGGHSRSAEAAALLASGWAQELSGDRESVRRSAPVVRATGDDVAAERDPAPRSARLPTPAWEAAREALSRGPVLVQVPRAGYLPALACDRCRAPARCPVCSGPLALATAAGPPSCRWCGDSRPWRCGSCEATALRAAAVGAWRTAEELGRAFPGIPVRASGGDQVLARVDADPAVVVATPGAEPWAPNGYAAALLLDGWALLARPELRAGEEALRRWFNAAALVRPGPEHGVVVVVGESGWAPIQALVRWDPGGAAERELADRVALRFPPAARVVELTGAAADVDDLLRVVALPDGTEVLSPVDDQPAGHRRALLRSPRAQGGALAEAVRAGQAVRSARRAGGHVRVRVDPVDLA